MRAEAAREVTRLARQNLVTSEYDHIHNLITVEANSGNGIYQITEYGGLMLETIELLEEDGYVVTTRSGGMNETDIIISWK